MIYSFLQRYPSTCSRMRSSSGYREIPAPTRVLHRLQGSFCSSACSTFSFFCAFCPFLNISSQMRHRLGWWALQCHVVGPFCSQLLWHCLVLALISQRPTLQPPTAKTLTSTHKITMYEISVPLVCIITWQIPQNLAEGVKNHMILAIIFVNKISSLSFVTGMIWDFYEIFFSSVFLVELQL